MVKIYESPDGGKTVYVRESNSTARTLIKETQVDTDIKSELRETQLWHDIRCKAKTNQALKKELERIVAWYYLLCDNTDSSK